MLGQVEKIFKKWSPAIFLGWSSLNFDEEMIRKEFFKSISFFLKDISLFTVLNQKALYYAQAT